jgi:hypothetical protein
MRLKSHFVDVLAAYADSLHQLLQNCNKIKVKKNRRKLVEDRFLENLKSVDNRPVSTLIR